MITQGSRDYRRATAALALSSFLVFCNLYAPQPMLPLLAAQFGASASEVNGIFAGASLGLSLSLLPWAIAADALGRRRIMLCSLGLSLGTALALLLAQSLSSWIVLRVIQGIGLAGFPAVAVAYMAEEFESKAFMRAVGSYVAANSVGGIAGRLIGGGMSQWFGIEATVWTLALLTAAGVSLVAVLLPKPQHFRAQALRPRALFGTLLRHLRNPYLWPVFLISMLAFGIFINLFSVLTFRLHGAPWHLPASALSLLFLCYLSGTVSASLAGHWSLRYSVPAGMALGVGCLLGGTLLTLSLQLWVIIAGLLINSIGFFLLHSLASAWVGKHAGEGRAMASALYLMFYYFGSAAGGFYLLYWWGSGNWPAVVAAAVAALLLIPGLLYALRRRNLPSDLDSSRQHC